MSESKRTLVFVGAALAAVGLAAGTHRAMQPVSLDEFSDVGEEFYPDFLDPNAATGLRVAAYNEDAARVDVFNVEFKDGLWRIPSHHNYPADGEDRLANTATSIIGITRDAIVSTSADDFKRLGVLDPLDESVTGTEGRGDRITLLEGDTVLADYIIGTAVEDQQNVYHVRRPNEKRTYRASLDIDISTKFADWIEPGLLDIRRNDLREIVIDGYSIDETRGVLVPGEVSQLKRESSTAPWELVGIGENEKVKTSEVNSIINGLEDLKIVGVRAKPAGLVSALTGEGEGLVDPRGLAAKGFFLTKDGFLSNEGEIHVGAVDGVSYVLQFGEIFTGSDVEIEIGQEENPAGPTEDSAATDDDVSSEEESADGEAAEGEATEETPQEPEGESTKQSRYLFIRTGFDESLVESPGEKPVAPDKPADSDGDAEDDSDPKEDTDADDDSDPNEDSADGEEDSAKGEEEETTDGDGAAETPSEEEVYQAALAEYEAELKQWEQDQTAHEAKLEEGRKRVAELNERFADWYYVISAESFDEIRADRADLVEAEEPDDESIEPGSDGPSLGPPANESKPGDEEDPDSDPSQAPPTDESTLPPADPKFAPPPTDAPPTDAPPTDAPPADSSTDEAPKGDPPPGDASE